MLSAVLVTAGVFTLSRLHHPRPDALRFSIVPTALPADGHSTAALHANLPATFSIVDGRHSARLDGARIIAGVQGGPVVVEARAAGYPPVQATLATTALSPGFALALDDPSDRSAFLGWFTWLAEAQYFARELPPDVTDCAALVRFAYREALREHDGAWASTLNLSAVPALPGIVKYSYPYTPVGARLFATADGYAEFADARTLIRYNAHFVTRDIRQARPGDLLFYRQLDRAEPYHTMVFLGRSQFESSPEPYVVYHTGPFGGGPGEIRRPTVDELLHHPSPQWRPQIGNPNFAGIFRWNILRRN